MIEYLRAENRVLKAQLRGRRVRLSDAERRHLALLGARLGRPILTDVATIVRDTLLRWHRPMSSRTFLRTHLDAMLGADRITSAFWTLRRWITYHAVCVTTLCSQGVQRMASSLHPHEQVVMSQVVPQLADAARPELVSARADPRPRPLVEHGCSAPATRRSRAAHPGTRRRAELRCAVHALEPTRLREARGIPR